MSHRAQLTQHKHEENLFRLKPLVACMRVIIAGGLFAGSGVIAVNAELPVPTMSTPTGNYSATSIIQDPTFGQATAAVTGHAMTIRQITDKATIDWKSFNIDKGYSVNFQQNSSSSIALNNIHQANASQILGSLTANGQVYLYNQNGFVFGKDSVVNTNSLLASTLKITDDVFKKGITQVFDLDGKPALAVDSGGTMDPKTTAILIEAGAKIHTDKSGRIIIAAPTIINKGSLTSENNGQIILAASEDKVYLQEADKNGPFKGLVVEVDTGGTVKNVGDILAKQGNITMAGFLVKQEGRVTATTSVNVNGSIRLLAKEQHDTTGTVLRATKTTRTTDNGDGLGTEAKLKFGSGSVTQIVADNDGATAIDKQTQSKSYLEAIAHTVELQANSAVVVPGGKVNITATDSPVSVTQGTTGRIYMDKTALVDVSGYKGVKVAMERNVGSISVQSFDLRNSPYQLGGVLQGETVQVDLRNNTSIVDNSAAKDKIQRGINERLSSGGTINLNSSGDVVINDGAKIDISGGSVNYQDGYLNTTKLITDYGRVVDISAADPNQHYASIYGLIKEVHAKWGVTTSWNMVDQFSQGQFQQGYVDGKAAGSLNIQAPQVSWNGNLNAGVTSGIYQRLSSDTPAGGNFNIDLAVFESVQNVLFQTDKSPVQLALNDLFPKKQLVDANGVIVNDANGVPVKVSADLVLDKSLLNTSGVRNVSVKTLGDATVTGGTAIVMSPGGNLSVVANSVDVNGSIRAAGGIINLKASANADSLLAGHVTLANNAILDVSGRWINDLKQGVSAPLTDPLWIAGGSVTIIGQGNVALRAGSAIKADGGAWLSTIGRLSAGKGGAINLAAVGNNGLPSSLSVAGSLSAFGLNEGGSLTLSSGKIIIGPTSVSSDLIPPLVLGVTNGALNIAPDMGFSNISLNANIDGVTVKNGVALDLKTKNMVLNSNYLDIATGSSIRNFSNVVLLPEYLRQPLQLSLTGTTGVTLETGSSITLDKASTVNLTSTAGSIYVDGTINTPAGNINLAFRPDNSLGYETSQSIWLGKHANLLVAGDTRMNPIDVFGRRTGNVLNGGNVTIDAQRGYVVLEHGANIDVSGTHAQLDIVQPTSSRRGSNYIATDIGSNAGKISITAAEGAVLDGNMKGFAGSAKTQAGTLALSLDRSLRKDQTPLGVIDIFPSSRPSAPNALAQPLVITINQAAEQVLRSQFGEALLVKGANGNTQDGTGLMTVSADKIMSGGFSTVNIKNTQTDFYNTSTDQTSVLGTDLIRFAGDVTLKTAASITLDAKTIGWTGLNGSSSGIVSLDSAFLRLGTSIPGLSDPTIAPGQIDHLHVLGGGTLSANSQWTELQGVSLWNGFKTISLDSAHDLRTVGLNDGTQRDFVGAMVTAANLNLQASQIYPSTLSSFTFSVVNNPKGEIKITGTNTDKSPLSAGGNLTFEAPAINQDGVLRAPLGTISLVAGTKLTLGADSVTSVSAEGLLIPFGVIQGGLSRAGSIVGGDWLYPLGPGQNLVFNSPPIKKVILNAPSITMAKGSKVDIAGGGNLFGYEFKPVDDTFPDYLKSGSASYEGGFAILPSLGSALAPYDPFQSSGSTYAPGSQVYLNGTPELSAGYYTILPAHYALLPGAFLVTPQAKSQDATMTTYALNGLPIVSGYQTLSGTGASDPRSSAFRIETSAQVLSKHAQYDLYTANSFYTQKAQATATAIPLLPIDSGQISIIAQTQLLLNGIINSTSPGGRGARMDIAANNIDVVTRLNSVTSSDTLQLLATDLNKLKVDSLMLGGSRTSNSDGSTTVKVTSNKVTFNSGVKVKMTDLVAAATQKVEVKKGASLIAQGSVNIGDSLYNIEGDGALLRLSADKQIALNRTLAPGITGQLVEESGATLSASRSMLLDASLSTTLQGDIVMHGGSLNLSANAINLGDVASLRSDALNLTNQKLMNLTVDELILNSRGTVSFYGNVGQVDSRNNQILGKDGLQAPITFDSLAINAAGFSGFGRADQVVRLQANHLILANPFNVTSAYTGAGLGRLDMAAANFTQGSGNFGVDGFKTVNLNVNNGFKANGNSILTVAADMNLKAGYLTTNDSVTVTAGTVTGLNSKIIKVDDTTGWIVGDRLSGAGIDENTSIISIDRAANTVTLSKLTTAPISLASAITDIDLQSTYAKGASNFKLDASGHALQVNGNGSAVSETAPGYGGAMEFVANSIDFDAKVLLPSGKLNLHALTGDLNVGSEANIDLAGRAVAFADKVEYTPGGTFTAIADSGAIKLDSGSKLDISSGGGSATGGNLILKAPKQAVTLAGQIKASGGSAAIDVSTNSGLSSFDNIMSVLKNAGISDSIYFRSRDAGITVNKDINANTITLVTDYKGADLEKGAVDIFGKLHVNGVDQGGKINIYAGGKIKLESGSQLTATGVHGGKVLLSSVDGDGTGISDGIELKNGSLIDVSGSTVNNGGDVALRALRTSSGINIQPVEGIVTGARKFYAEGVKRYSNAYGADVNDVAHAYFNNDDQINTVDITNIKAETAAYMTPTMMSNVAKLAPGMLLTPGVEIDYTGNLTLKDKWDLVDWRYNELPGSLVIKASGDFSVAQSLTDGFKTGNVTFDGFNNGIINYAPSTVTITDKLQGGESWSYKLVAGADMTSADSNATKRKSNLVIGSAASTTTSNTVIRTGTGDMTLTAGGDITFFNSFASVYNAGRPTQATPYGSLLGNFVAGTFYSEYPVSGGDLAITAGDNINGAVAAKNDFNDWLLRIGSWTDSTDHTGQRPTAWGVALGYINSPSAGNAAKSTKALFQQNVGSFGGGNVKVSAGGNISNLDVMMPTTGKQVGTGDYSKLSNSNFLTNQVEVNGGGIMHISAGNNITGGTYYLGKGSGTMTAGGSVTGGASPLTNGPELLVGDTRFSVNAGNGVSLSGVSDPMILYKNNSTSTVFKSDVNFFSYSASSALNIAALSGDVQLAAGGNIYPRGLSSDQASLAAIYPASLRVIAFGGNIKLIDNINLFPSAVSEFSLIAEQNITSAVGIALGMSDGDPTLLPTQKNPLARNNLAATLGRTNPYKDPKFAHATIHNGDSQLARIVTRQGDIENISLNLAKKSLVKSGRDITNVSLAIQNINSNDVTILDAGRDFRDTSNRDLNGILATNSAKIEVAGPSDVLVKAGRNIDLGASGGISTVGNVVNTNLSDKGSNITVLAGLNGVTPDYVKFLNSYAGQALYAEKIQLAKNLIVPFMRKMSGIPSLSESSALVAFAALPSGDTLPVQSQLNSLLLPVMFNEVNRAGSAAAAATSDAVKKALYAPGTAAINALFPGNNWKGDVNLYFSKLQTIKGGDINILVPGGQINAGLAVDFTGAKDASELGIVAQQQGNINAVLKGDFLVNKSRVFSLDGGDIMIWSSEGNIDAGKGAKSSISAPPPTVSLDKNGNLVIEFPPIVSGSGIRTASSSTGVLPGNVGLFAPVGVVNAGEAGIGGTNVTISATAVLGANNIQVSGTSTGVPVASVGSIAAGLTGTSNVTANASQTAQAAMGGDDKEKADNKNMTLGMLSVELLGFGE
jgi:filamentous hemagglutinin family protein